MKRQQITKSSILEIPIENQYYVYAQILHNASYAIFDYRSDKPLKDFSVLLNAPVLFILAIYNNVVNQGHWLKVGKLPIRTELKTLPMAFIEDALNPGCFELYNPNTGEITPTTKDQCIGLERAAVWEAEHVESRIRDHYNSVPNIWVEQMKLN